MMADCAVLLPDYVLRMSEVYRRVEVFQALDADPVWKCFCLAARGEERQHPEQYPADSYGDRIHAFSPLVLVNNGIVNVPVYLQDC